MKAILLLYFTFVLLGSNALAYFYPQKKGTTIAHIYPEILSSEILSRAGPIAKLMFVSAGGKQVPYTATDRTFAACHTERFLLCQEVATKLDESERIPALHQAVQKGYSWATQVILDTIPFNADLYLTIVEEYLKAKGNNMAVWSRLFLRDVPVRNPSEVNKFLQGAFVLACKYGDQYAAYNYGAQVQSNNILPLVEAVKGRHEAIVEYIFDSNEDSTSLVLACENRLDPKDKQWLNDLLRRRRNQGQAATMDTVLAICKTSGFLECMKSARGLSHEEILESGLDRAAGNLWATVVFYATDIFKGREEERIVETKIQDIVEKDSNDQEILALVTLPNIARELIQVGSLNTACASGNQLLVYLLLKHAEYDDIIIPYILAEDMKHRDIVQYVDRREAELMEENI